MVIASVPVADVVVTLAAPSVVMASVVDAALEATTNPLSSVVADDATVVVGAAEHALKSSQQSPRAVHPRSQKQSEPSQFSRKVSGPACVVMMSHRNVQPHVSIK